MKNRLYITLTAAAVFLYAGAALALDPPVIQVTTQAAQVDMAWAPVDSAQGYTLYYAAYPFAGPGSIGTADLGNTDMFSFQLWAGAAFYLALAAYDASGAGGLSNVELVQISDDPGDSGDSGSSGGTSSFPDLPAGIVMKSITGGSFTMGNNALKGPQAGDAVEHQVTLSDFQMGETEITNAQYVEFLNAAYTDGLIDVETGTAGADLDKTLVVGTAASDYDGKVLYELSGTRVMKDHDNDDKDNDPFTGIIEPENPLNIAYIGFDSTDGKFYVKDPRDPGDFNWMELTNYYNYGTTTHMDDTSVLLNDFDTWSELAGWTETDPTAATGLPTQQEVSGYPVTFIRWWGANAFALYYGVNLPTEAQWEYAAKGGQDFEYAVYDGSDVSDANWNSLGLNPAEHHVRAAKSGQANPFGLYNLGGNVWEWMADNYQAYAGDDAVDPLIEVSGSTTRAWRGGSWNYHQATLETAGRYYDDEDRGNDHFGFRITD